MTRSSLINAWFENSVCEKLIEKAPVRQMMTDMENINVNNKDS